MMAIDTVTVSVYQSFLLEQLKSLQADQKFCDIQLTTSEGSISAHKVVLLAASPRCQTDLGKQQTSGFEHISFDNTSLGVLQVVVDFMYSGELRFAREDFANILSLCEQLKLTSAVKSLKEFQVIKNISQGNSDKLSISDFDKTNACTIDTFETQHRKQSMHNSSAKSSGIEHEETPNKKKCKNNSLNNGRITRVTRSSQKLKGTVAQRRKSNCKVQVKSNKTEKKTGSKQRKVKAGSIKTEEDPGVENDHEQNVINVNKKEIQRGCDNEEKPENKADVDCNDKTDLESSVKVDEMDDKSVKRRKRRTGDEIKAESEMSGSKRRKNLHPCSICNRILTSKKRLIFHQFSKHGSPYDEKAIRMFHCKEQGCSYVAASKHNLQSHMNSRHREDRPHICEFCGKAFKLPNVLSIHLNIHTGTKLWKCETCGDSFNQQSGLAVHIKRHHMGESSWEELCHLCSEKFLYKVDLAWHLYKTHDQPLPEQYKLYVCDICNYQTKSNKDLQRHRNAHDGIKQYVCPICKRACSTKSDLKRHVSFHGEKKFKCTFEGCTYACTETLGLKKHRMLMHTHKNYKPYLCPVCSYKTGVKGNLDKHIRTVHNLEVVTKHTLHLKMKYASFESGDIITKEGNLVASAKDRKALQDQYHAENPELFEDNLSCSADVTTEDSNETTMYQSNNGKVDPNFDTNSVALSSVHSSPQVAINTTTNSVNSSSSHSDVRQFNYLYLEEAPVVTSVPVPVVAEDLRISMANQTSTATSLYTDTSNVLYIG